MKPVVALFALFLSACIAATPPAPSPPAPAVETVFDERAPDTCKAAALQALIGQPAGNLRTVRTPGPVRLIVPGTVYDQEEYRSDRINAFLDVQGLITRFSCG